MAAFAGPAPELVVTWSKGKKFENQRTARDRPTRLSELFILLEIA